MLEATALVIRYTRIRGLEIMRYTTFCDQEWCPQKDKWVISGLRNKPCFYNGWM